MSKVYGDRSTTASASHYRPWNLPSRNSQAEHSHDLQHKGSLAISRPLTLPADRSFTLKEPKAASPAATYRTLSTPAFTPLPHCSVQFLVGHEVGMANSRLVAGASIEDARKEPDSVSGALAASPDDAMARSPEFQTLTRAIKAFIEKPHQALALQVSPEEFQYLNRLSDREELHGWGDIRLDYDASKLILQIPSHPHESVATYLFDRLKTSPELRRLCVFTGSSDVHLFGQTQLKSPDLSFHENLDGKKTDDQRDTSRNGNPTLVIEVGVTQTLRKLNFDAARLLIGSLARIQSVLNFKIHLGAVEPEGDATTSLKWATADLWSLREILPKVSYQACEMSQKMQILAQDKTGYYVASDDDEHTASGSLEWIYHYCHEVKGVHVHYKVKPCAQYVVYHNQKSKLPDSALERHIGEPILVPRFLVVSDKHPMFTEETRFNHDIIIELEGLVDCIKESLRMGDDSKKQPAEATLKRPHTDDDAPDIVDEYERILEAQMRKKRKQDGAGQ